MGNAARQKCVMSNYYNFMLGDEECNEEYYQAIYDTDFDVDIFEAEVIDEMAKLLIALHVLMLSMNSKKRVKNAMKLIAREHIEAVLREKDRIKGV